MSAPWSLRSRLIALIGLTALAAWVFSSAWLYRGVLRESERMFDAALIETAYSLLAVVTHELADEPEENSEIELEAVDHAHRESVYFQVRTAAEGIVFRSPGSPRAAFGSAQSNGLATRMVERIAYRVYTLSSANGAVRIDVAQPLADRAQVSQAAALRLLLPGLLLVLVLTVGVYVIVRQVVAPIVRYSAAIDRRTPGDTSPLAGDALPSELKPVTAAIDGLLQRVDAALLQERTLTADAAHELRTPLAALRAQAQVALRAKDDAQRQPALQALIAGVDRSARVVDSVLALARLDAREFDPAALALIDLGATTEAVLTEVRGNAERRGLALNADLQPAQARADVDSCAVLLRNLLDNALRHARSQVHVELHAEPGRLIWRVRDDGDGMPAEQRARAFDRFYRASDSVGAGLGLAMVQRVAELHRGGASIIDGIGGRGVGVEAWIARG